MTFRSLGEQRAAERQARAFRQLASRPASRRMTSRVASIGAPMRRVLVTAGCAAAILAALSLASEARAAGSGIELEQPRIDQGNVKSLQRGAKHFINNCFGCHTADYARYSRVAADLGLSDEDVESNLIFTTDAKGEASKIGSLMANNMTKEYGELAFGVAPPNLALTARSRGTDWIYTFLKSFYLEPDRTGTGVNNLVYPGTAMPHVLWPYQGWQTLDQSQADDDHAAPGLHLAEPGSLSAEEYDSMVSDITNFLAYMADPIKQTRHRVGTVVLLFLFGLLAVAWLLKKEYWKDVV